MSFELQRVLESKGALRRRLAGLPIADKLRLLDTLRERTLAIRGAGEVAPVSLSKKEISSVIKKTAADATINFLSRH